MCGKRDKCTGKPQNSRNRARNDENKSHKRKRTRNGRGRSGERAKTDYGNNDNRNRADYIRFHCRLSENKTADYTEGRADRSGNTNRGFFDEFKRKLHQNQFDHKRKRYDFSACLNGKQQVCRQYFGMKKHYRDKQTRKKNGYSHSDKPHKPHQICLGNSDIVILGRLD